MNQRLTELYRSCRTQEALASQDQFGSANVLIGSEIEKFAELIVQECAEVAHCNFHVDGLTLGGIMKQYFGVE